jgi:ABC-2 type transport system ATP-binding protein
VSLDAAVYRPDRTPAPAVVLAHGFGGSKESVVAGAEALTERGFVVVAYSARGFGESTGTISMNSPEFEVADASGIIDYLATRPDVVADADRDPRVGFAGGSYGGALSLLIAGHDERVDAVAADITWNDLEAALFGQSALDPATGAVIDDLGAYKQLWSGLFFSAGLTSADGEVTTCGRFAPQWCRAYTEAATDGIVSAETAELMRRSSPVSIADRIAVPTLLGGGQADSLFPLAQVDATATQIRAAHPDVPLKVVWHAAGHDGGVDETERLRGLTADWFTAHLAGGPEVPTDFEMSLVEGSALSDRASGTVQVLSAADYPGLSGDGSTTYALAGPPQQVLAPAGGVPAAITSLPGVGGLAALASSLLAVPLPNQAATFVTEPLSAPQQVAGSPRVRIAVSSDMEVADVTLFASIRTVGAQGRQSLPNGLVAPIRLERLGPVPTVVDVQLPTIVTEAAAGDRLALVVSTTDQAFRMPTGPAVYTIALADTALVVPTVAATASSAGLPAWAWPVGGLAVAVLAWLVVALARPRYRGTQSRPDLAEYPVVVDGLVKQFPGGVRAVDGVGFTVPPGVVLGLLGPNGAGKSTTMRMIMGLIAPTAGEARVFGQQVHPGSPALARIGCFVEGPGFLPHLTGRQNLDLFWRASGRTDSDPQLDDVLEIAGLGAAIDRRVRTYSQGMRQRLGIAQAMLGLPDLLLLDEPTNGLDPPQIKEMRMVVQDYARDGRTVIVSSHLLSEVEQTCSHVVVMSRGTVIASGTVADLLAGHGGSRLEDVFLEMVGEGHEVVTS